MKTSFKSSKIKELFAFIGALDMKYSKSHFQIFQKIISYHFDKHEQEPKVLTAILDVIRDGGEEGDEVLDDDVDGLRLVLVVLHLAGEGLLQEVGEVDPDVPGGGLHQVRLDVLQTLLRGQEVHQPLGGRRTEGDDVVDGVNPVNHAGSRKKS